jgi:phosphohistidine phosphatase
MNIYLIRHSKAEPSSPIKKDKDRELTNSGIELIKSAAEHWKSRINNFDYLFTSPFIRAVQTANLVDAAINSTNDIILDKSLSPGTRPDVIIRITDAIEADEIAFVGHQPDMSFIISRFIGSYEVNLKFAPASIAKISFKGKPKSGKGMLEFLLPPD